MTAKTRWLVVMIYTALVIIAAASLVRVFTKSGGSFDFHCYWYGGNFIWQGVDPYRAFFDREKVDLPISYLDGVTVKEGCIDPFDRRCIPGNTAPVVFLLSPLARFSWDTAYKTWRVLNTLFALAIGGILLKILDHRIASHAGILLILLIIVQLSTREALDMGQTSLLATLCIFASMCLTYCDRTRGSAIASGIFLGIALSKFLLAFPLLLLFIYRRRIIEVMVGACVQVVGLWGITLLGTSLPSVLAEYFKIFMMHAGPGTQDGMYLTAGLLKGWQPYSYLILTAGSAALGILLLRWHRSRSGKCEVNAETDLVLLTVVILWNLLVFYHRRYDYVAASSFLALIIFLSGRPYRSAIRTVKERTTAYCMAAIIFAFWTFPFYRVFSEMAYRCLFNICALAALSLSTWILLRLKPDDGPDSIRLTGKQPFSSEGRI